MPVQNNPELADRLRDFLGLKGPAGIDTVSPEIVPVIITADLTSRDPGAGLVRYCMGYGTLPALASNYPHVGLYNPATSDCDVQLDQCTVKASGGAETQLRWYDTQAGFGVTGNKLISDIPGLERWTTGSANPKAALTQEQHTSVYGSIIMASRVDGGGTRSYDVAPTGIRLTPGKGIVWVNLTVNTSLGVSWSWRELVRVP